MKSILKYAFYLKVYYWFMKNVIILYFWFFCSLWCSWEFIDLSPQNYCLTLFSFLVMFLSIVFKVFDSFLLPPYVPSFYSPQYEVPSERRFINMKWQWVNDNRFPECFLECSFSVICSSVTYSNVRLAHVLLQ